MVLMMTRFTAKLSRKNYYLSLLTDIVYANSGKPFRDHCWVSTRSIQAVPEGCYFEFTATEHHYGKAFEIPHYRWQHKNQRLKRGISKIRNVKT